MKNSMNIRSILPMIVLVSLAATSCSPGRTKATCTGGYKAAYNFWGQQIEQRYFIGGDTITVSSDPGGPDDICNYRCSGAKQSMEEILRSASAHPLTAQELGETQEESNKIYQGQKLLDVAKAGTMSTEDRAQMESLLKIELEKCQRIAFAVYRGTSGDVNRLNASLANERCQCMNPFVAYGVDKGEGPMANFIRNNKTQHDLTTLPEQERGSGRDLMGADAPTWNTPKGTSILIQPVQDKKAP